MNNAGAGHFNVFSRSGNCAAISPYGRRDFYKVSLVIGTGKLFYADKWIRIDRPVLLFSNPLVPYSWEAESEIQEGWFCLFTEAFIQPGERKGALQESPLFRIGAKPVYFVTREEQDEISGIFRKMVAEINSNYSHKYSLLRSYLHLLIHEALKMQPAGNYEKPVNASSRIASLFMELLERQFPVDSPDRILQMKTANDYARHLSVHVNHLNRAVKMITGKTTTTLITSRIIQEARALLKHTDWSIAQIAYSLGFEYPAYFNNLFKKNTGATPGEMRQSVV